VSGARPGRGRRAAADDPDVVEGVVVRQDAKGCVVRTADGVERFCAVRGKLHLEGPVASRTAVVVGDRVRMRPADAAHGTVEEVAARRSVLARPDPHDPRRQRLIAANVDRIVIASSVKDPPFNAGFVDRVLVAAEWSRVEAVVAVMKSELDEEPEETAVYRRIGYRVLLTSAARGDGLAEARALFASGNTVVTGPSGVGKSSLLNALVPGLALRVGAVNEVSGRGRQTTTSSVLTMLPTGGAVVDTPGLREFGQFNVPKKELPRLFVEFRGVAPRCRFKDCLHAEEPGCAFPAAIEAGEVAPWRFDSYLRMLETAPDVKSWETGGSPSGPSARRRRGRSTRREARGPTRDRSEE
jgi:ribosome biogenesis GTPase